MPPINGKAVSKTNLLRRIGDISQIARVKPYRLQEGFEDGLAAIDVITGSGFEFTVLPGRGMDISAARYKGLPLAWRSPVGDRHASYYEPHGLGWLRTFGGGLVVTCGLTHMGAPCDDGDTHLGLHGRASSLPAGNVRWSGEWIDDDYRMTVEGVTREASMFGYNIQLTRRITAFSGKSILTIDDVVENLGFEKAPNMILYHCNLGYPFVDEGARIISASLDVTPRDSVAQNGLSLYSAIQPPSPGYQEQVFSHNMKCGKAAIVNESLNGGLGIAVRYDAATLPFFTQWKMLGEGTYVVGLEPGNALVMGRPAERAAGRLQYLESGEKRNFKLEIEILDGKEAIAVFEDECNVS